MGHYLLELDFAYELVSPAMLVECKCKPINALNDLDFVLTGILF